GRSPPSPGISSVGVLLSGSQVGSGQVGPARGRAGEGWAACYSDAPPAKPSQVSTWWPPETTCASRSDANAMQAWFGTISSRVPTGSGVGSPSPYQRSQPCSSDSL